MQPDRIGRYRLDRLLATQATCETHAGWDEQLDRQVLVARVPLDGVDSAARDLWRRDVRALSGVTHPGLVHVLDILHQDGCDWVVSEWVEGEPVDVLAARQPLAGCEAARLGAELAETLAALHQHAVRHGGVCPVNVLVTSGGHVKLGGGCAPSWERWETAEPRGIEPASRAPEQLAADLRGLGEVLLALAGTRPGGTPAPEPTAALLAPTCGELAAPLASSISRCLGVGHEPPFESAQQAAAALRALDAMSHQATLAPQSVARPRMSKRRMVALGLLTLATAAVVGLVAWWWLSTRRPLAVAVLPVDAPGESEDARLAALAVNTTISTELSALPDLVMVSGREVQALRQAKRTEEQIARQLAVQELVEIKLSPAQSSVGVRIDLVRRRARDGHVEWSRWLESATWEPAAIRELVSDLLRGAYSGAYAPSQMSVSQASPEAVKTYFALMNRRRAGILTQDRKEEIAIAEAVLRDNPRFTEAWQLLANYYYSRYYRNLTRDDLRGYEHARDKARGLGASPMTFATWDVSLWLRVGDTSKAVKAARELVGVHPGNPRAWQCLGEALAQAGQFVEAESAYARSTRLFPSASAFVSLAWARSERGDHAGARAAVAQARTLGAESTELTATAASVEMYAGNLSVAEDLYRALSEKRGRFEDFSDLGVCLYYQGKLEEAAAAFRRARELAPQSYLAARNLADTLVAMGDEDGARALYSEALAGANATLLSGLLLRDAYEARTVCLARLGRAPEATRALGEMVKANPNHPESIFTAALVAAVMGERASAMAWTKKAVERHAPKIWFDSPEFTQFRRDPDFLRLVAR